MARTLARRDMQSTPEESVLLRDKVKMVGVAQPAKKYTTRRLTAQWHHGKARSRPQGGRSAVRAVSWRKNRPPGGYPNKKDFSEARRSYPAQDERDTKGCTKTDRRLNQEVWLPG